MQIFKLMLLGLLISFSFSLGGCQGTNSDVVADMNSTAPTIPTIPDTNTSSPVITVILPVSSSILTTNNEIVNISVRVFDSANNPYSTGTITKVNPSDVLAGRDVGTFDKISSTIVNGIATFVYTAPDRLDENTSNISFAFYHDSNSSNVKIYTMSIVPEANQTVLTNYTLETSNPTDVTVGLESSKLLSYTVYDSNNNQLDNASLKSIKMTSLNPSLGILEDTAGNSGTTITILNKNNVTVNIKTNTKSGIVPLKVDATFNDINGDEQNLSKIFNVVVLSGPPSAMSLSYSSTDAISKKNEAKMVEKWVLTVTDKYSNLVNTNPAVSMGMLAGYTKSTAAVSNPANYLFYLPSTGNGTLSGANDNFTAPASAFGNVDQTNEYLITFGNGYTYNASGKWDINTNSNTVLDLIDDYDGSDTSGLGYAVGNNYRQDACQEGVEWVANVYPEANNYIVDGNGSLIVKVEYDYYLVGKDTMLWVNLTGSQNSDGSIVRLGEAKKITLRGSGLTGGIYSYAAGYTGTTRLLITISDTVEYYRNANFRSDITVTGDGTVWNISGTSMVQNITSCVDGVAIDTGGVAYVDVTVTASPNAGEIKLTNVLPTNEF
jgi:hypothetical protein